jgi:hypothetical protein
MKNKKAQQEESFLDTALWVFFLIVAIVGTVYLINKIIRG